MMFHITIHCNVKALAQAGPEAEAWHQIQADSLT